MKKYKTCLILFIYLNVFSFDTLYDESNRVQNACSMYLCYEDGTQIFNTWYFNANGGCFFKAPQALNIPTDADKNLCIWASTDPGSTVSIKTRIVSD